MSAFDKVLLTTSQVRDWQSRLGEIAVQSRHLQAEAADINRKLDAVKALFGELPVAEGDIPDPDETDNNDNNDMASANSLAGIILRAVRALPGAPKAGDIKRWVIDFATTADMRDVIERAGKPYFYTVIMRHAEKGRLIKDGDGYRLPTSSAQAETGGVVAPPAASIASPSTTSGPPQAAPKAGGT